MTGNFNPFQTATGPDKFGTPRYILVLFLASLITGYLIATQGLVAGITLLIFPFLLVFFYQIFRHPALGLYTALCLGFILLGITRYFKGFAQVGIAMDGILVFTYIALIFNRFYDRVDWKPAKKDITVLAAIWLAYGLLQFFNPEIRNREAWLAGMRGISLYMLLFVPLVLIFVDDMKKIRLFFRIWGIWAILATMKGLMQNYLGVDHWEKAWLDSGGAVTHILFGKLRIFSFFSDASQFGTNQAYTGVVFSILFFYEKNWKTRIFYAVVACLAWDGMFLSGTRGAIVVPLSGFLLFFILKKNKAVTIGGFILLAVFYVFFKYTMIGQGNQQIRRMRTAFDPNDASLQVRLANQKRLAVYLSSRPFGGGIGHAGVKAQRYLPNAFLSQIATDSWYVLIWAELGIVGLTLHLLILFYIMGKSCYLILFRIRDPGLQITMSALAAGMAGIMVTSYSNSSLGTMPNSLLIYFSMAVMMNAMYFDNKISGTLEITAGSGNSGKNP